MNSRLRPFCIRDFADQGGIPDRLCYLVVGSYRGIIACLRFERCTWSGPTDRCAQCCLPLVRCGRGYLACAVSLIALFLRRSLARFALFWLSRRWQGPRFTPCFGLSFSCRSTSSRRLQYRRTLSPAQYSRQLPSDPRCQSRKEPVGILQAVLK